MRLEHHLVGGYVRYISPRIIIIIIIAADASKVTYCIQKACSDVALLRFSY